MAIIQHTEMNRRTPTKLKDVNTANTGHHYIIGPREATTLRGRLVMFLEIDERTTYIVLVDNGQLLDRNDDIEVVPTVKVEMRYWV